jgi:hypothetical protein
MSAAALRLRRTSRWAICATDPPHTPPSRQRADRWHCSTGACASPRRTGRTTSCFRRNSRTGRSASPLHRGWSAAALKTLAGVVDFHHQADDVEIEIDVAGDGPRRMLLSARRIHDQDNPDEAVAVGLTDVTDLRLAQDLAKDVAEQQASCCRKRIIASPTACRSSPASCF